MCTAFDREAERIVALLPPGSRLAILGSASFHHPESQRFCQELGRALAEIPDLVLLTGGVRGVGEAVGRAFHRVFEVLDQVAPIFHVLPEGPYLWDYGQTLYTGTTMEHRREVLARLAGCYVVIEGGPGTEHEASVAATTGARVIPVGCYGGYAGTLWAQQAARPTIDGGIWRILGSVDSTVQDVADAVAKVVQLWQAGRATRG
jgi:predicted Rossmann-fold nucleotide-binding protein